MESGKILGTSHGRSHAQDMAQSNCIIFCEPLALILRVSDLKRPFFPRFHPKEEAQELHTHNDSLVQPDNDHKGDQSNEHGCRQDWDGPGDQKKSDDDEDG